MKLKLEELTLEQKIGMVLCARRYEEKDVEFILELIRKRALGCVQLSPEKKELVDRVRAVADYPIIIVEDTETGFPGSSLPKVSLNALAACNDPKYCRAYAKGVVRDAKAAGYNGTWGPIIDILECNAPATVSRVFSDDVQRVSMLAEEVARIYNQNHYFSCGKHFPGSAGISADGHMSECPSEFSEEYVIEKNLAPYRYLLERGLLPTVMVGHATFKKIDPDYPSSLSKKTIDLLRNIGFDGVIFTDSFAMMNVLQKFSEEKVYGMAMNAGVDIILPNYRTSVEESYNILMQNYKDGMFTEERLNDAVRHVLALQDFISQEPENPTEFTAEDEEILNNVARDCITAITDDGVCAALEDVNKERLFVIVTEMDFEFDESFPEVTTGGWYQPMCVAKRIKERFPGATIEFIPEFSTWRQHDHLLTLATKFKEIVPITFCTTTCYLGTDGLTRRTEAWINCLQISGKVPAIVHFGNPFALQKIRHVPRRIFGYSLRKSQQYAIDVLAGEIDAKGTIPFDVDFD